MSMSTRRRTRGDKVFDVVNLLLVLLVVILCIYPLYYTVIASFSEPEEVLKGRVLLFPSGFTLDSYRTVFTYEKIWRGYLNTIGYTVVGTLYNLFLLLPASYAMAKKGLRGKGILMGLFVFTMYFNGGMIPNYLLMKNMALLNSPWVMIIPAAFSVYDMIITRTFFAANFPDALSEAARIDGAGEFRIFFQIALPLSGAIIAVMALFHALGHWNDFFNAMIYLSDARLFPLQLILRDILLQNQTVNFQQAGMSTEAMADLLRRQYLAETMKYALIFIANLPMLIAYPFVQKHFVKGVVIGAVKG